MEHKVFCAVWIHFFKLLLDHEFGIRGIKQHRQSFMFYIR